MPTLLERRKIIKRKRQQFLVSVSLMWAILIQSVFVLFSRGVLENYLDWVGVVFLWRGALAQSLSLQPALLPWRFVQPLPVQSGELLPRLEVPSAIPGGYHLLVRCVP